MKNKYIWERKPDPENGYIYEFKVNQTDLVSVYISTQNKTNSNEMAFEINEKSDFLSGLNNFHKLYETLFDICCDYIITTKNIGHRCACGVSNDDLFGLWLYYSDHAPIHCEAQEAPQANEATTSQPSMRGWLPADR